MVTPVGVQVEGGGYFDGTSWWTPTLPAFHPELHNDSFLDIFVEGPTAATWTATPSAPWIHVDRTAGSFSPGDKHFEDRLHVSVDWDKVPPSAEGLVTVKCSTAKQPYGVHVQVASREAVKGASFIEANGIVSIYAAHADTRSAEWEILEGLGHTGSDIRTPLAMHSIDPGDQPAVQKAPSLIYRFVTNTSDDKATLNLIALPTFPITSENGLRVLISIDGGPKILIDLYAPEFSQEWRRHAMDNAAIGTVPNLRLLPGPHTLTVYALDPGVTLDRFEVSFSGAPTAYGPVPETRVTH